MHLTSWTDREGPKRHVFDHSSVKEDWRTELRWGQLCLSLIAELGLNTLLITTDNNKHPFYSEHQQHLFDRSVCLMLIYTCADLHLLPLTVGRHVDGPPYWYRRPSLRDAQHLHWLPLRPPLTMTTQHWRVYAFSGRVCWAWWEPGHTDTKESDMKWNYCRFKKRCFFIHLQPKEAWCRWNKLFTDKLKRSLASGSVDLGSSIFWMLCTLFLYHLSWNVSVELA